MESAGQRRSCRSSTPSPDHSDGARSRHLQTDKSAVVSYLKVLSRLQTKGSANLLIYRSRSRNRL